MEAEIAFSNLFKNYKLQVNFKSSVFLQQPQINVDKSGKPGQDLISDFHFVLPYAKSDVTFPLEYSEYGEPERR